MEEQNKQAEKKEVIEKEIEICPNCGSNDVNCYTDRFFCFNCKYNIPSEKYLKIKQELKLNKDSKVI